MNFDLSTLDTLEAKLKGPESKSTRFAPRLGARGRPRKASEDATSAPRPGVPAEQAAQAGETPTKSLPSGASPKRPIDALIAAAHEQQQPAASGRSADVPGSDSVSLPAASPPQTPLPRRGRLAAKSGQAAAPPAAPPQQQQQQQPGTSHGKRPEPASTIAQPRKRGRPRKTPISTAKGPGTPTVVGDENPTQTASLSTEEEGKLALALRRGVETMTAKSLTAEEAGQMSLRALVAWGNLRDRRLAAEEKQRAAAGRAEDASARPSPLKPAPEESPATADAAASPASLVPQVTVGSDGRIVIAETSLVVQAQEQLPERRVVTEEHFMLNSTTYSNRLSNERWSAEDTELFYKALSQFGTDFTLISHLFPGRQRPHLKNKFKRESKRNPKRVDEALEASAKATATSYQDMIAMLKAGVAMSEQTEYGAEATPTVGVA